MRNALIVVLTPLLAHVVRAQVLPPLDPAAVASVDRALDASACDGSSRGLAARALAEIEGELGAAGRTEERRLPASLLEALNALANADLASRAAQVSAALESVEAAAAVRTQCGDPAALSRRTAAMSATERVREVWRACRLDRAGLSPPRRDVAAADLYVQVVVAVVGNLMASGAALAPIEVRLLQTMIAGSAPQCGTATPPASDEAPEWLEAPPPRPPGDEGVGGDRRYRIEPAG